MFVNFMKNKVMIWVVIGIVILVIGGGILFFVFSGGDHSEIDVDEGDDSQNAGGDATVGIGEENTCTDSDGGKDYAVKGTGIGKNVNPGESETLQGSDYCRIYPPLLIEYYCEDALLKEEEYECPNGCSEGACIGDVEPLVENTGERRYTCTDSDGGKAYFMPGRMEDEGPVGTLVGVDECISDKILKEYYCSEEDERSSYEEYECPETCFNNACYGGSDVSSDPSGDCEETCSESDPCMPPYVSCICMGATEAIEFSNCIDGCCSELSLPELCDLACGV